MAAAAAATRHLEVPVAAAGDAAPNGRASAEMATDTDGVLGGIAPLEI